MTLNIIRFRSCIFSLALLFSTSVGAQEALEPLDKVVAIVNNSVITQNEMDNRIKLANQQNANLSPKQAIEELVLEELQLQRAAEMKASINNASLDKILEHIAKQNKLTVEQLIKAIESEGLSLAEYKKSLKTQHLISHVRQKEVLEGIEISEQEVNQFLKSATQMAQSQNAAHYRIGHILIPLAPHPSPSKLKEAQQQAEVIIQKLQARQAVEINDLGWRKAEELPTLFANIVPNMSTQSIQGPIQSESGLHIIQLLDKKGGQALSGNLETQKQQAYQIIRNRKANEKLSVWLQKLRNEAYVQLYLEDTQEASDAHAS